MDAKKKIEGINDVDAVQETGEIYAAGNCSSLNNSEDIHPVLKKLILKSIQDSKEGKGISHEEMKQKIKLKYHFLK
jgi:hypothetical protein